MRRTRRLAVVALGAVAALALGACGGPSSGGGSGGSGGSGGGGGGAKAEANAGIGGIANPSDVKGGTLRLANSSDWDSLDPADTYYAYAWNFARLYGRTLVGFKAAPGTEGAELVPDLAESLGTPNADATQWTYKLKPGVKFEDGSVITSRDVKYAIARSLDKETFPTARRTSTTTSTCRATRARTRTRTSTRSRPSRPPTTGPSSSSCARRSPGSTTSPD